MPMENKINPTPEPKPTQSSSTSGTVGRSSANASAFQGNNPVMQPFKANKGEPSVVKVLLVLLLMAGLGIGTGYGVAVLTASPTAETTNGEVANSMVPDNPKQGETYGNGDPAIFKDTAEGVLKDGGIEGEGQYHLERPGGESQNVYLISSTVDLSKFMDKEIKVWGQTQAAQHAGWLMDVGKVEVL